MKKNIFIVLTFLLFIACQEEEMSYNEQYLIDVAWSPNHSYELYRKYTKHDGFALARICPDHIFLRSGDDNQYSTFKSCGDVDCSWEFLTENKVLLEDRSNDASCLSSFEFHIKYIDEYIMDIYFLDANDSIWNVQYISGAYAKLFND